MDEKDYELILTLYELKNITKASEKLFISQPALTKRIKKIEKELGTELLLRSKKGVIFTPLGESIIPYIRNVTSSLKQMRLQVDSKNDYIGGTLSVGVSINYSQFRLPKILKSYMEAFPNVDVNIITDQSRNLYRRLENDEISVAVLRGEFKWNEGVIKLSTEPMCLVCSKEHANDHLNSFPYIGRHTDSTFQEKIQTWLKENSYSNNNTKLYSDNIGTCLEMAKFGLGWAILPEVCLENFHGYIRKLNFADGTPFTRSTYILYRNSYYTLPQVKLFIEYLQNKK